MGLFADMLLLLPLVLLLVTKSAFSLDHYKREGHSIMKRMAEGGQWFEGHDVARVHLVDGLGQPGRRLVKRDLRDTLVKEVNDLNQRTLQLALSTGSHLNITLTPSNIIDKNTVVAFNTEKRRLEGSFAHVDCYSHGTVDDSSGRGMTAVSHCDGLFGFANSHGFDYFLHPVESKRSKRDTATRDATDDDASMSFKRDAGGDEFYDVHIMWRRSQSTTREKRDATNEPFFLDDYAGEYLSDDEESWSKRLKRQTLELLHESETSFTVEIAMFSDAKYCETLQILYPGREDDFLLTRFAGVQALFGNRDKVGYDVQIKVKVLEYWNTNPDGYTFTQDFGKNLKSFCAVAKTYPYDVLALNSGITKWNNGRTGLAHVSGACTGSRCMIVKGATLDTFKVVSHELGHLLGMNHHSSCPEGLRSEGGFMGGPSPYNFSPCMKFMLEKYLATSKSNCLFKEDISSIAEFNALPKLFPGQVKSPDRLCQFLAGSEFRYVPNERYRGDFACRWLMCLNDNEQSVEFRRARFYSGPIGFTCHEEAFCDADKTCKAWDYNKMALDVSSLRALAKPPEWSEWSAEFSECSRSCGTGVRSRRRVCLYEAFSLSPFCLGLSIKPEVCNTQPCPDDPLTAADVRRDLGGQICSRFLENNVQLKLRHAKGYTATSTSVKAEETSQNINAFQSQSCLMKCIRNPKTVKGDLDAIFPDGTPCNENRKTLYDLDRLNIEMKCIGGHCLETSDCPDMLELKDDCGVCGGDGTRCVKLLFDSAYNVPRTKRSFLTDIPPCSRNIDVRVDLKKTKGVIIELWSKDDVHIIGDGGQYPRADYENEEAVEFAGTWWTYKPTEGFLRAAGPLQEAVKIKALRLAVPIKLITINYANSA